MRLSLFLALILIHTTVALPVRWPQLPARLQFWKPEPKPQPTNWPPPERTKYNDINRLRYQHPVNTPRLVHLKGHIWAQGDIIKAKPSELLPLQDSSVQVRDQIKESLFNTPCWMMVTRNAQGKGDEQTYGVAILSPLVKWPYVPINPRIAPDFIGRSVEHINPAFSIGFTEDLKISANTFSLKTKFALNFKKFDSQLCFIDPTEFTKVLKKMKEALGPPPPYRPPSPPIAGPS